MHIHYFYFCLRSCLLYIFAYMYFFLFSFNATILVNKDVLLLLTVYVTVLSEESLSPRQLYRVLGNSINVRVVSVLIHLLVTPAQ